MNSTVKTLLFVASLIALFVCFSAVENEVTDSELISVSNTVEQYDV